MTFPTPYTVKHLRAGGATLIEDGDGNTIVGFSPAVDWPIYQMATHDTEAWSEVASSETADIDLYGPVTIVGLKDRFVIYSKTYETVGVQDWNHGFHGWKPGIVVAVKRID